MLTISSSTSVKGKGPAEYIGKAPLAKRCEKMKRPFLISAPSAVEKADVKVVDFADSDDKSATEFGWSLEPVDDSNEDRDLEIQEEFDAGNNSLAKMTEEQTPSSLVVTRSRLLCIAQAGADELEPHKVVRDKQDILLGETSEKPRVLEHSVRTLSSSFLQLGSEFGEDDCKQMTEAKHYERQSGFRDPIKHCIRYCQRESKRFKALKTLQVLLAICGGILTLLPAAGLRDPDSGLIVDCDSVERTEGGVILVNGVERAIVAATQFQVICIGITRMSAFFMYPALIMVFTSKFRATTSCLSKSPLAMYMYKDSHELHVYCGHTILIFSIIHAVFHIARWAQQGNMHLLVKHFSGISGLLIIASCLLICLPMVIFRKQIQYEVRKKMHYLFLLFALALMHHTPSSAIPNGGFTVWVFGTIVVGYFLDVLYCLVFMTEKIETTQFSAMDCGVRVTINVSDRFQGVGNHGGVCYVCLPWIDKHQWHAFSLFENPANPAERQIFIQKAGDWTSQVHQVLQQRETVRPVWVSGPFPSPYDNAVSYDNQILVASGIGITPALSVIRAHKESRRINLIWAVRDAALIEFFWRHLYLDHNGWNIIFYTGKKPLHNQCVHLEADTNVCIISGRPNLKELIPNIIYGIESGLGLPENYTPETKVAASEIIASRMLSSEEHLSSSRQSTAAESCLEEISRHASKLGFNVLSEALSRELGVAGSAADKERRLSDPIKLSASIRSNLTLAFRPWQRSTEAKAFVKNLDKSLVLSTWGVLYCGGAKQVLKILKETADEYKLSVHVEAFDW